MKNKDAKYTYENDCLMLYREAMNDCMNKPNLLFLQCKVSEYDENGQKYSLKFNEESRTCESFKQQCELFGKDVVDNIIETKLNGKTIFQAEDSDTTDKMMDENLKLALWEISLKTDKENCK